jgi:hypothetical protein
MALGEQQIVRHREGSIRERAHSRSMAPSASGPGRDHHAGRSPSGRSLLADPLGLIVEVPGPDQHAIPKEREWLLRNRPAHSQTMRRGPAALSALRNRYSRPRRVNRWVRPACRSAAAPHRRSPGPSRGSSPRAARPARLPRPPCSSEETRSANHERAHALPDAAQHNRRRVRRPVGARVRLPATVVG